MAVQNANNKCNVNRNSNSNGDSNSNGNSKQAVNVLTNMQPPGDCG
jgi:hypothetical protein